MSSGSSSTEIDIGAARHDGATTCKPTMNAQLWALYRSAPRPKPPAKEVKEALAFFKCIDAKRNVLFPRQLGGAGGAGGACADVADGVGGSSTCTVVDCCGGHGLVALLVVIFKKASSAFVFDLFEPKSFTTMRQAWASLIPHSATVTYLHGDVTIDLQPTLRRLRAGLSVTNHSSDDAAAAAGGGAVSSMQGVDTSVSVHMPVTVLSVHACDFLTDLIIEACMESQCCFAVMPCCGKDRHNGAMKAAAQSLGVPVGALIDVARVGHATRKGYAMSWRTVDCEVTPENRVIIGVPPTADSKNVWMTGSFGAADVSALHCVRQRRADMKMQMSDLDDEGAASATSGTPMV